MTVLRKFANVYDPNSFSNELRNRRFEHFSALLSTLRKPVKIIDIGGTYSFWKYRGATDNADFEITIVNLLPEEINCSNMQSIAGDATDLKAFANGSFDVAFSNSVIEHLKSRERQALMAAEIRRLAPAYYVQTPSFWFPIEPHFHVFGWQWIPKKIRARILQRRRCGFNGPIPRYENAFAAVDEVRLLRQREFQSLFPGSCLWKERIAGLTKSFTVYGGFDSS